MNKKKWINLLLVVLTTSSAFLSSCNKDNGEVAPTPAITGFSPSEGMVGSIITITGTNFDAGTATAKLGSVDASVQSSSETEIKIMVPEGATSGKISLTLGEQTITTSTEFTVIEMQDPPVISSIDPESLEAFPGAQVVIRGENLSGVTALSIVGSAVDISSLLSNTETTVGFLIPMDANIGSGKISLTTGGGTVESTENFEILDPLPKITQLVPQVGFPGQNVRIIGQNLGNATLVTFNGLEATIVTNTDTEIEATIPAGAETGAIKVTTSFGTGESIDDFVIELPVPKFTSTNDKNGFERTWVSRGDSLLIKGEFFTTVTDIKINDLNVDVRIEDDNNVWAIIPENATSGKLEIIAPGGTTGPEEDIEIVKVFVVSWFDGEGEAAPTGPLWVTQNSRSIWISGDFVKNGTDDDGNDAPVPRFDEDGAYGYVESFRNVDAGSTYYGDHRLGGGGFNNEFFDQFTTDLTKVKIRFRVKPVGDAARINCRHSSYTALGEELRTLSSDFAEYSWDVSKLVTDLNTLTPVTLPLIPGMVISGDPEAANTNNKGGLLWDYILFTERLD
ncbi:MAG: IPT/TIG domain-containing protein [Cyclobacteriaceae bacterium]